MWKLGPRTRPWGELDGASEAAEETPLSVTVEEVPAETKGGTGEVG